MTVETPAGTATGTTLATTRRPTGGAERPPPTDDPLGDGAAVRRTRLGTPGGEGRLTVAVPTADAGAVLRADRGRVAVHPTGTTPEFEAVALLERAGQAVRRLRLDRADLPEGVRPLAVRRSDAAHPAGWVFDVDPDLDLDPGTELFVAGTPAALDRLGTAPDAAREADG